MNNPLTLVFLGDIAAGKGTQAKIIAKKFGLKLVGTGVYSRKIWHTKRGARIKTGRLTPSDIIQKFLRKEVAKLPSSRGVLVDGGKMPAEARLLNRIFTKKGRKFLVIYLTIPRKEIYERLRVRVKKEGRADDSPAAIRNRMEYYKSIYSKTVKFWKKKDKLKKISGKGTVAQVTNRILKIIRGYKWRS